MKAKIGAIIFLAAVVALTVLVIYNREHSAIESQDASQFHLAKFSEQIPNNRVKCGLCPNKCVLSDGQIGNCRARKNIGGRLYSMVYGKIAAAHLDPIEKKPFYHVLPGSKAFSIATTGCNLQCKFCQNWQIAQVYPWEVATMNMSPEEVVQAAVESGAASIAFTYSEPTIFIEYIMDIATLARQRGLKTVVVSAGYINPEPLKELLKYIDAIKIDFKGYDDKFYAKMTKGHLQPVLDAMKVIKESGVWLEIVNLVIPSENDSDEELRGIAKWVKDNMGTDVPLHFTRFHPEYKIQNLPPTPIDTLKKARQMALDMGLKYVYTGNIYYPEGDTTFCPISHEKVIERQGFFVVENNLKDGLCADGEVIPCVWR